MEITRHFTATTFVVHEKKVLLHLHKKLGLWLPPGGHIDRDELPEEAAVREVKEETGLDVTLLQIGDKKDFGDAKKLLQPEHILLENINPFHQHIDFIFFARAESDIVKAESGEATDIRWLRAEELDELPLVQNVKALSLEALHVTNSKTYAH